MKKRLLDILERDASLSIASLATRLDCSEDAVRLLINELIADRQIIGYKAILPESNSPDTVEAMIEVKIAPRREGGFDTPAKRIAYAHVTGDMQKNAANIVNNYITDILGKELKPWQSAENQAKEQ